MHYGFFLFLIINKKRDQALVFNLFNFRAGYH